ncbi:MAG TPA: HAD-IIB family hydrolase [Patescibacteria group bacterium]|nr:HAD-IIB family hydrolase [Patescibacteria group bacterium]
MKKVIAFDLDETLTETRTLMTDEMAELLGELLKKYHVCVISGGSFEQFQKQFIANLKVGPAQLASLHLMPTCGTRYYRFNATKKDWQQVYAENFTASEKATIIEALNEGLDEAGYRIKNPKGALIEDRGSQVTYSALGQDAGAVEKKAWDASGEKKRRIRDIVAIKIPQFEVRVGGTTSIDVTKQGIDKAYGMKKLIEILNIAKEDILFIGDRLWEGGNDYPVKLMGIDSIAVGGYEHTPWVVRGIIAAS